MKGMKMRSDSEIMNSLAHSSDYLRELTAEESSAMKKVMLAIYSAVAKLCEREGLTYMMSGGTCLGAIRHQGFIPWDDDLDIMMPRNDYDRLVMLLCDGALGPEYDYSFPNKHTDANTVFLKIFMNETLNVELVNYRTPFPKGVFIDVFPIDSVPRFSITRSLKGLVANGLQFISICVLYAQYPSAPLKEYMGMNPVLARRYRVKRIIGRIASIIPHKRWVYCFDRFVASSKDNHFWGIPTGRKYYNGEVFPKEVFVPVKKATFEGLSVYVPNDTDKYLRNLYNNYMQLPPPEKRERHFVVDFDCSKVVL